MANGEALFPTLIEHAYSIWDAICDAKENVGDLTVLWLDLSNAYGSVPHALIEEAMEFFWFPKELQKMLMQYYNEFVMRFTTEKFTTEWHRLEVGIAAGCTISVILFVLVMEMILRSTNVEIHVATPTLKAFMDDITILAKSEKDSNGVLKRLDELIVRNRMMFKAKKSRSCTIVKGKHKELHFSIGGDMIPTVKEKPVKSLGRWYTAGLSDHRRGMEIFNQAEEGLRSIDKTKLSGKFKLWCLQYGLYPRLQWPLMMYEVAATRVERIEQRCSVYIRKWLRLPKQINTSALYGRKSQLSLPITSIVEEYKAGKVRTVMMLRYSKDSKIKENPPVVRTYRKWSAESEVDDIMSKLSHQDIVGYTQTGRSGLGVGKYKPFYAGNEKEKRDAVVTEVRKNEQEKRYLHLIQCNQQGQCVKWEEDVVERKLNWKDLWKWEPARLSFLVKSTYDMLPTPANLTRWKISENEKCRCGQYGSLRHILSSCTLGLKVRYTWRHNQVLRVIVDCLESVVKNINEGRIPTVEKKEKVIFHKEGNRNNSGMAKIQKIQDTRWTGKWNVAADLDSQLVFPVTVTAQRPDCVIWNTEKRIVIILELTIPWEENIKKAEERKEQRYEKLIEACRDKGWDTEYYHLAVGCRGYVDKNLTKLFKSRFCLSNKEVKKLTEELQEVVERASFFIWLKRDDANWMEKEE